MPDYKNDPKYHPFSRKAFFLNGKLHRALRIEQNRDTVYAWSYPDHGIKVYSYSSVRKHMQRAYTAGKTAELLDRSYETIARYIKEGIPELQRTYGLNYLEAGPASTDVHETGNPGIYYFSEDDVMWMRDYLSNVHIGRPRHDKHIHSKVPTRQELRLRMQHEEMVYVKDRDGNFVPIWKAND